MCEAEELFRQITAEWFRKYGSRIDPLRQADKWSDWMEERERSPEQKYRKALQLACGCSEAAVRQYVKGRIRHVTKLLSHLDRVSVQLGRKAHDRGISGGATVPADVRYVALLTQTDWREVPSVRYHWEVISSILEQADRHEITTAVHPVTESKLDERIEEIVRLHDPDAAIIIRLTPSESALDVLRDSGVATLLVHAERRDYPPPVLANVVPSHTSISEQIRNWAGSLQPPDEVVVVSMPRENTPGSVRNERIDVVCEAFNKKEPDVVVPDYSFRHALHVFQTHPKATIYVALSDEIALAIKQILTARQLHTSRRVLGFDNSHLAQPDQGNFSSIDQGLGRIGREAIERLCHFVYSGDHDWPRFEELPAEVQLQSR